MAERCSFCGGAKSEQNRLFRVEGAAICAGCIQRCSHQLGEASRPLENPMWGLPRPAEIVAFLDRYVIGQARAKRALALALYAHYKRIENPSVGGVELEKSNILLAGPTGSGKTLLARTLARVMRVPFAMADATALTEAGYVGEDVEGILSRLLSAANYDVALAQKGIVYIDEIDKIAHRGQSASSGRDVGGEGVQQALLRILEGGEVYIPVRNSRKEAGAQTVLFDTTQVLFIVGGAFEAGKSGDQRVVGFSRPLDGEESTPDRPRTLIEYGLIPEFVGRLPVVVTLEALTHSDLVRILSEPQNALLRQFSALLAMDGVELVFEPEAIEAVAELALKRGVGARGLRALLEERLEDLLFELPDRNDVQHCTITAEFIHQRAPAQLSLYTPKRRANG